MNRRVFLSSIAASAVINAEEQRPPTAREIVEQIKQHVGVPWSPQTVDTFKAGNPDTPVRGIASVMMATFESLKRAAERNLNFVITHEPTFYSHQDKTEAFEAANDPVWRQKEDFIREHGLVVWRFHDHWHRMKPDGIMTGVVNALGWNNYRQPNDPMLFVLPRQSLRELASGIETRLGIQSLRVVGNADLQVTNVALMPGAAGSERHFPVLRRPDVQVLAIGEVPEWETIEYAADAAAEGRHKGLILIGHIPSEQAGMQYCAEWLKTFITGVPIEYLPMKELVWQPR